MIWTQACLFQLIKSEVLIVSLVYILWSFVLIPSRYHDLVPKVPTNGVMVDRIFYIIRKCNT